MTLEQFMRLVPVTQEMQVCYDDSFIVHGTEESLGCMLCEDIYNGDVTEVEAEGDVLKVWVKEAKQ